MCLTSRVFQLIFCCFKDVGATLKGKKNSCSINMAKISLSQENPQQTEEIAMEKKTSLSFEKKKRGSLGKLSLVTN